MYANYCQNKPRSEAIWKKYSECAFFQVIIQVLDILFLEDAGIFLIYKFIFYFKYIIYM